MYNVQVSWEVVKILSQVQFLHIQSGKVYVKLNAGSSIVYV